MTEWEPATEAEAAMREALRGGDQEEYFRILARTELLLPVSADSIAGQAPVGWGTWTTSGRTHVLAFTSGMALQACLAENAGSARRMPYPDLAAAWPNLEWWLAVNPGLPIEGYLPAWFVTQLARGDVRLPGRSMAARSRLERAESAARARATAVVPGRVAPPGAEPTPAGAGSTAAGPGGLATPGPSGLAGSSGLAAAGSGGLGAPGSGGLAAPGSGGLAAPAQSGLVAAGAGGLGGPGSGGFGPAGQGGLTAAAPAGPRGPEGGPGGESQGAPEPGGVSGSSGSGGFGEGAAASGAAASGFGGANAGGFGGAGGAGASGFGAAAGDRGAGGPGGLGAGGLGQRGPGGAGSGTDPGAARPGGPEQGVGASERRGPLQGGLSGFTSAAAFRNAGGSGSSASGAGSGGSGPGSAGPGSAGPGPGGFGSAGFGPGGSGPGGSGSGGGSMGSGSGGGHPDQGGPGGFGQSGQGGSGFGRGGQGSVPGGSGSAPGGSGSAPGGAGSAQGGGQGSVPGGSGFGQAGQGSAQGDQGSVPGGPGFGRGGQGSAPGGSGFGPGGPGGQGGFGHGGSSAVAQGGPTALNTGGPAAPAQETSTPAEGPQGGARFAGPPASAISPLAAAPPPPVPVQPTSGAGAGGSGGGLGLPRRVAGSGPAIPLGPIGANLPPISPAPGQAASAAPTSAPPVSNGTDVGEATRPWDTPPATQAGDATGTQTQPWAQAAPRPSERPEPRPQPQQPPVQPPIDFKAANEVEESLLAAAAEGSTDNFLSTLLLAKVLLPVSPVSADGTRPGEPGFAWLTETIDGEPYVVVFTSMERLQDHLGETIETIDVKFMQLIKAWPDPAWSFAVNPSTPVGAKLPGVQILALANWATDVGLGGESDEPEPAARPAAKSATPDPNQPTIMQKAVSRSQVDYYLERGYDRVSGFVHRANEVAHLNTPAKMWAALGLGYAGSAFKRDADEIFVLRWPAYRPSLYRIPYGGQNEPAMRAMEGWVIERAPFRGNGFAPSESGDVIAEFKVDSARLPHGAQLWRVTSDGVETLVALLDADAPTWRKVGER